MHLKKQKLPTRFMKLYDKRQASIPTEYYQLVRSFLVNLLSREEHFTTIYILEHGKLLLAPSIGQEATYYILLVKQHLENIGEIQSYTGVNHQRYHFLTKRPNPNNKR